MSVQKKSLRRCVGIAVLVAAGVPAVYASDHADPISLLNTFQQEGGITDLFVFPEPDRAGQPILNANGRPQNLIVILCVRRRLGFNRELVSQSDYVTLEPYTYTVYMDTNSTVNVGGPTDQNTLRYGGAVDKPENIRANVKIEIKLKRPTDDGLVPLREPLRVEGLRIPANRITLYSGIRDDPFIFPPFFGTNVVAMVMRIPIEAFSNNEDTWVVWATASRDGKQVDHVGRSLRTQNPRFDMLNTLEPKDHVAAIEREIQNPSLMRSILLRLNLQSVAQFRPWDKVPDVMIYSLRNNIPALSPVGFPNGRKLTDDVAKLLADWGDTLLFELSYIADKFPRATTNDKVFSPDFPYLAEPHVLEMPADRPPPLSTANRFKLLAIVLGIVVLWLVTAWVYAVWYHRRKLRQRFL
jgi:hypothetical protein